MYHAAASPWGVQQPPPPGTQAYGYPPAPPSYHQVQVRQTFAQPSTSYPPVIPPQPPIPVPAPAQKQRLEWSQSVRNYVSRTFDASNSLADFSRAQLEAKLKEIITAAQMSGTLDIEDWDNKPLPQEVIRQERKALAWQQQSVEMHTSLNNHANAQQGPSKKRKSQEMGGSNDDPSSTPPWRVTNNQIGLEDRITHQNPKDRERFNKRQQPLQDDKASKFQKNLEKRQRRFDGGYKSTYKPSPSPEPTSGPVVGTNQELEKQYFRLTAPPVPSFVRPEHILRQTLDLLKKKWKKEGNYSYICDQFKSMRQDLTVQRVKNEFTVNVYEIHARIALEKGDLGEYNQCQTQLRVLYAQNLGGNPVEFKAYRILYFIHTSNRTALNDVLADLTTAEKNEKAVRHALDVRSSLALGNYHRFFRLYLDTPNMGAYLMDMFVVRERLAALANMCKAYKPEVSLRFVTEELAFEGDGEAAQFICDHGGQHLLLEERPDDGIRFFTGKAGQLFEAAKNVAFRKVDIKGQI